MKYRLSNTLAHFNAAPQTRVHDLSNLPVAVFSAATKDYRKHCGQTSPNDEATTFYTLNHCASIVRKSFTLHEPLPEWAQSIMQTYTDICMAQGERLFHYMLSITTREMRHVSGSTSLWDGMKQAAGPVVADFIKENKKHHDSPDAGAVGQYMNHPPTATIGQYVEGLSYGFWKGWGDYNPSNMHQWQGGYGGPHWALVAEAVKAMLKGETSMEMLVDTGYTLAHNGGPIFDKGMMYTHYDDHLITVLDVQRSGQMLDLMVESNTLGVTKPPVALEAAQLIKAHCPKEFKGFLDWKLVDDLRPAKEKAKHPAKYVKVTTGQKQPMASKPATAKAKATAAKAPLPTTTVIHGKTVKVTGEWQVYPNQTVKTYERTA